MASSYTQQTSTQSKLLHREAFTQSKLLHREAFTQRSFYTEKLLHTASFCTEKLLHTASFCIEKIFTESRHVHREPITRDAFTTFYTQQALHKVRSSSTLLIMLKRVVKGILKRKIINAKMKQICSQRTVRNLHAAFVQPPQCDSRLSAAKRKSITHAACGKEQP